MRYAWVGVLVCVIAGVAQADDGFRCPDTRRLISLGDSTSSVRHKCREPDERSERTEVRRRRSLVRTRYGAYWTEEEVTVRIEDWLYDFGQSRFLRELRFEDDRLVRVTSGSYGSR